MSALGLLLSLGVIFVGLRLSTPNLAMFIDGPSLFIVLGGTFAALSIAFSLNKMWILVKVFLNQFLKSKVEVKQHVLQNIIEVAEALRSGESIEQVISKAEHPFLREGLELMGDGVLNKDEILHILSIRAEQISSLRKKDVNKVKTMGKYPPAFGMMGTTIGMIVLLANLGGADAMKTIGPAMGVCLITTLYGVIIANLFVLPVADNLENLQNENNVVITIIFESFKHLLNKSNPILIMEELNSYLIPSERVEWNGGKK
jgi:chemotaxis protein MotA